MWHDLTGLSTSEFLQQEYKYFNQKIQTEVLDKAQIQSK
jgi:hypothetical protein